MNLSIFGSDSLSGKAFLQYALNEKSIKNIYVYSRKNGNNCYIDLIKPSTYQILKKNNSNLWISYTPIWIFANFLQNLYENNKSIIGKLDGIIAFSSTSAETKKHSFNSFDKDLYKKLITSEEKLLAIAKKLKIKIVIIRPTLIYGKISNFHDKNLSKIIRIMRLIPIIIIPSRTGFRQPIHISQLSKVTLKYIEKIKSAKVNDKIYEVISIGGDENISYLDMLKKYQNSLDHKDLAKRCKILKIPNRIYYFLLSFLILISPKFYEALLRINSSMAFFLPSYKILDNPLQAFPIKDD